MCKYHIIRSPQGFSGIIYNTGWGTLPDCLRCSLQVMKEWVMMPPYMSVCRCYCKGSTVLLSYLKTLSVGPAWVWTYGLPLGMRSPNWGSIKMSSKPRSETSLFDSYCNSSVDTRSMHKYRFFICLYVSLFRTPSRFLANIWIWNDVPIPIRLSSSWWLWFEHWRMGIRRFGTIPQVPSSTQY